MGATRPDATDLGLAGEFKPAKSLEMFQAGLQDYNSGLRSTGDSESFEDYAKRGT